MHIFAGGEGGSLFNPPQVVSYWRGLYLFMLSVSEHKAWHTGIAHLKFIEWVDGMYTQNGHES